MTRTASTSPILDLGFAAYHAAKTARPAPARSADELLAEIARKIAEARG